MTTSSNEIRQRHPRPMTTTMSTAVKDDDNITNEPAINAAVVVDASPPGHTVLLLTCMVIVLSYSLPSLSTLDEIATLSTFTHRYFPNMISIQMLAYLRAGIAMIIWIVTLQLITCPVGWEQMTPYQKQSKLKMVPNHLVGRRTLYPFTSWYVTDFTVFCCSM
jgi:membrane protein insertase Oxa1/YidC/SpoIIIJ